MLKTYFPLDSPLAGIFSPTYSTIVDPFGIASIAKSPSPARAFFTFNLNVGFDFMDIQKNNTLFFSFYISGANLNSESNEK
jgi:hypothetical protein